MKKSLLTGSLATLLLLAACGTTGEDTTEEANEGSATETSELTAENEELKEQNQQLQEQVAKLESDLEASIQNSEEVDIENSTITEEESENVASGDSENSGNIKMYEGGDSLSLDTIEMSVDAAVIFRAEASQDDEYLIMGQDVTVGDELDVIAIQYTVENTSEEPKTFFLDQAEIVTSNGHQLQSELLAAEGMNSDMKGAVKNTGTVPYVLPDNSGEEIEWVDIIIPWVSDENYTSLTEEQKLRIEFK